MTRFVISTALLALVAVGCSRTEATRATAQSENVPQMVTVSDAVAKLERGEAILVDVRERNEVVDGMAAPAIWMPLSSINAEDEAWRGFLSMVEEHPDKQIIAYCRSGNRSGRAASLLAARGYKTANMGGFDDWASAGQPTKRPENPEPGK